LKKRGTFDCIEINFYPRYLTENIKWQRENRLDRGEKIREKKKKEVETLRKKFRISDANRRLAVAFSLWETEGKHKFPNT